GYPSDPVTRAHLLGFIQRGEAFPPYVRTRWATLDNLRQGQLFG
ncbi:MAG: ribonuclease HII, partial [Deltaproteobacteria bacterium]|nr:ribonuclease HII [Deltaproteobacteria bacterium]